eukprot:CAMPEP_0184493144 /NCGR_PEP_ID=MMETSP0113_2-20130426/25215_1 /TAXON_ID=91329 /ORGANISM="Norrisiella sphaerica, Strain BC52" /LENGTH=542 /DNA_ID=CAMNT_0026878293 /DNA_START=598 /DNA_END=2226 /DNA_ORIENTATION=-
MEDLRWMYLSWSASIVVGIYAGVSFTFSILSVRSRMMTLHKSMFGERYEKSSLRRRSAGSEASVRVHSPRSLHDAWQNARRWFPSNFSKSLDVPETGRTNSSHEREIRANLSKFGMTKGSRRGANRGKETKAPSNFKESEKAGFKRKESFDSSFTSIQTVASPANRKRYLMQKLSPQQTPRKPSSEHPHPFRGKCSSWKIGSKMIGIPVLTPEDRYRGINTKSTVSRASSDCKRATMSPPGDRRSVTLTDSPQMKSPSLSKTKISLRNFESKKNLPRELRDPEMGHPALKQSKGAKQEHIFKEIKSRTSRDLEVGNSALVQAKPCNQEDNSKKGKSQIPKVCDSDSSTPEHFCRRIDTKSVPSNASPDCKNIIKSCSLVDEQFDTPVNSTEMVSFRRSPNLMGLPKSNVKESKLQLKRDPGLQKCNSRENKMSKSQSLRDWFNAKLDNDIQEAKAMTKRLGRKALSATVLTLLFVCINLSLGVIQYKADQSFHDFFSSTNRAKLLLKVYLELPFLFLYLHYAWQNMSAESIRNGIRNLYLGK